MVLEASFEGDANKLPFVTNYYNHERCSVRDWGNKCRSEFLNSSQTSQHNYFQNVYANLAKWHCYKCLKVLMKENLIYISLNVSMTLKTTDLAILYRIIIALSLHKQYCLNIH